jgi:hypothetical protein
LKLARYNEASQPLPARALPHRAPEVPGALDAWQIPGPSPSQDRAIPEMTTILFLNE